MKQQFANLLCPTGLMIVMSLMFVNQVSFAETDIGSSARSPIRVNEDAINGIGLEEFPWEDPSRTAKWSFLFRGEELSVSIFESAPVKANDHSSSSKGRVKNYPYDQFVVVLSGKSILTDEEGISQTFSQGDYFIVPKGFAGTWEEVGAYRELIVIDEEAVRTRPLEIEPVD